ncbi:sugar kinase [Bacillus dakarensis]|uniref:sugar kinase n=1 Tax=Robertmurraya dakarensis TaxID=1926278 RepID=UPI0009824D2F|nr:sugar kinase [Bacillus dakarensis]
MDIITIGDALVAFEPAQNGPLRFVNSFDRKVGGAELNVAIGCSRLGLQSGWISRLGKDEFGRYIYNFARGEGIDVSEVQLVEGHPTSIYFKEKLNGDSINSYYYRHSSPTITFKNDEMNEEYIRQAKILHITGVFPAIAESNASIILQLVKLAKKHQVLVTLDPNIRLKLWSAEKARETLHSFLPYVDVLITGEEEAEILFGTSDPDEVKLALQQLGIDHFVLKQGERGAMGFRKEESVYAPVMDGIQVVDVVGAGDAFASGYLYSLIQNWPLEESLSFANGVAAHVIGVAGDNEGLPYKEDMDIFLGKKKAVTR